jgi:transposase
MLWAVRSGMRREDLPVRCGKYKSVHKRFMCWARSGVWDRVFADLVADKKNPFLMLDLTIVGAHQKAATGHKKGRRRQGSGAFPRWTDDQCAPFG